MQRIDWQRNCECECDKLCDVGKYLDSKNCKCRKTLVDELVEECIKDIDEKELHPNKMIGYSTLSDYKKICSSCVVYVILFVILFCWTYKWEILSKLILLIIHITFLMIWLILKTLIQA